MANKKVSQLISKPAVNLTDLFLIADPTSGQAFKTTISDLGTAIGSGVSSVNGLVGAVVLDTDDIQELASPTNRWFTDTRARAALSAVSPLAYNSGTGVFSIPQADGSTNGFLTSADWTTFNAKQAALNGTGFVKISGTTISYDNSTYLTTSAAASTYLALSGGTLTGALNGTSATFTGDLTLSATNPRLYFTDTDNNPDYFISNTDGTFTIYDVTNSTSRLTISTLNTILNTNLRVDGDVLIKQDSVLGGVSGYTAIASDTDGIFLKLGTASAHAYLVLSSLTSFRNFTFPDATGTIALTSNLSSYLPLTGGTLTGGLSGTTIALTTSTLVDGLLVNNGSGRGIRVINSGAGFGVIINNETASSAIPFVIQKQGADRVYFTDAGAGVFSSTLTATGATLTGALSGTSATFTRGSFAPAVIAIGNSNGNGQIQLSNSSNYVIGGGTDYGGLSFTVGGAERLFIANGGAATFSSSVTANKYVLNGTNGNSGQIIQQGDLLGTAATNFIIQSSTGNGLGFLVNGGTTFNMFINSSGNVGIGTTAPSNILHAVATLPRIIADTSSQYAVLNLYASGSEKGAFYLDNTAKTIILEANGDNTYPLLFRTAGSERMRITSSGNVGIGTTSPTDYTGYTTLHLNGKSGANGGLLRLTASDSSSSVNIYAGGSAINFNTTASVPYVWLTQDTERMRIASNGDIYVGSGAALFFGASTATYLSASTSVMTFAVNNAERMRITSVGHIQTNGNPVYAYSGSISIGGTYQTIFAAVSGGVYLVSVTTDSADGTFGLLTVINDPDKSLGMIYGNNISLQFSGDNVQMKSTNGSTYNTTWTATRLK